MFRFTHVLPPRSEYDEGPSIFGYKYTTKIISWGRTREEELAKTKSAELYIFGYHMYRTI